MANLQRNRGHVQKTSFMSPNFLILTMPLLSPAGVAPGISRLGANSSNKGAKIHFQCTINVKDLQKAVLHLLMGG